MKKFIIKILGGYYDKESFLDSLKEEDRDEVLNRAIKKLFNTIDKDDIFKLNENGVYTFEGKPQTKDQVEVLRSEAKHLLDSKLFRVVDKEVKYQANIRLRQKSKTELDIISAKLIEWTWDVVVSKLKNL